MDKLIVAELRQWHIGLLQYLFFPDEVEQIVRLLLSLRTVPDRRTWHYERHRKFSVRNAYHVARAIISAVRVGASFSASIYDDGLDKLWRKLWNACVPGKVKICVWKACMEAPPTTSNLIKRRVIVDNFCVLCGSFGESTEHMLRECSSAKPAWFGGLGFRFEDGDDHQFMQWLLSIALYSSSLVFELCLMISWMLWKNRNDVVWNGARMSPQELVVRSESWL